MTRTPITETTKQFIERATIVGALAQNAPAESIPEIARLVMYCIVKGKAIRRVTHTPEKRVHPRWEKHIDKVQEELIGNLANIAAITGAGAFSVQELPGGYWRMTCGRHEYTF